MGTLIIRTQVAVIGPQSIASSVINKAETTGSVLALRPTKVDANKNSFQQPTKINIPIAIKQGEAIGITTLVNNVNFEQPSIVAASSISSGKSKK